MDSHSDARPNDHGASLTAQFDAQRPHLQAVAYRMLGSLSEAEDAVQEAWLRLQRADTSNVVNLGGWLTTVVGRLCLDMLRTRKARREEELTPETTPPAQPARDDDPETEAMMADSVGLALLVVLDTLTPIERLAFVLHDLFAVPFDEIAPIIERTVTATRQIASRARRRVQGTDRVCEEAARRDIARQHRVVEAFLAASRRGDFDALLTILDPDVVQRIDRFVSPSGVAQEVHGARTIARRASGGGKGGAKATQSALIDGAVGVVVAPQGRLVMVLRFTIDSSGADSSDTGRITAIDVIADPTRLAQLDIALLPDWG